jgi:hypothetical protein
MDEFLERAARTAERASIRQTTLSKKLFADARTLCRLRAGGSCRFDSLVRASKRLEAIEAKLADAHGEAAFE